MKRFSQALASADAEIATVPAGRGPAGLSLSSLRRGAGWVGTSLLSWFGETAYLCWRVMKGFLVPPYEGKEVVRQMDEIGAKSLPVVLLAGSAIGVVSSLRTRESLETFGAKSLLPALIVLSIIKETGPIITALIACGRVGAGIGAELGSMRVTEQIDAIEASAVDPYKYLVATRIIACTLMLPLLTIVSDFFGIVTGWFTTTLAEPMTFRLFLNYGFDQATFSDFFPSMLKAAVFGAIIGIIGCHQGMTAEGGTRGVGRASTSAVVLSSLFVILADVVLVRITMTLFE